ncbi:hypothetical protein [Nonomuraea dietziae]
MRDPCLSKLPGPGEKVRAGRGELAARKGSSLLIHEARRLSEVISA